MDKTDFFELIHNAELLNDRTMTLFMNRFNSNVNISQIIFLSKLKEQGPQKSTVLAKSLGFTAGAITGITNKLVKDGLIYRLNQEDDRRVRLISITDAGIELLNKAQVEGQNMRNEVYSALNEEESKQLLQIQKKLLDHVQKLKSE